MELVLTLLQIQSDLGMQFTIYLLHERTKSRCDKFMSSLLVMAALYHFQPHQVRLNTSDEILPISTVGGLKVFSSIHFHSILYAPNFKEVVVVQCATRLFLYNIKHYNTICPWEICVKQKHYGTEWS